MTETKQEPTEQQKQNQKLMNSIVKELTIFHATILMLIVANSRTTSIIDGKCLMSVDYKTIKKACINLLGKAPSEIGYNCLLTDLCSFAYLDKVKRMYGYGYMLSEKSLAIINKEEPVEVEKEHISYD